MASEQDDDLAKQIGQQQAAGQAGKLSSRARKRNLPSGDKGGHQAGKAGEAQQHPQALCQSAPA